MSATALGRTRGQLGQCIRLGKTASGWSYRSLCSLLEDIAARLQRRQGQTPRGRNERRPRRGRTGHDAQKRLVFSLFTMSKPKGKEP